MVLDKLQTYPALKQTFNAWFTVDVMDSGTYSPSESGIAQGDVLSPLLMNVALHGMEAVVTEGAPDVPVMLSAAKHLAARRDGPFAALRACPEGGEGVTGHIRSARGQGPSLRVRTVIAPSQEASKRHLVTIDQRLQQLQTASQARLLAKVLSGEIDEYPPMLVK